MYYLTPEMMARIIANIAQNSPPVRPVRQTITVEEWQVAIRRMCLIF